MRALKSLALLAALAAAACGTPGQDFPPLADLPAPAKPATTPEARADREAAVQRDGDTVREAGRMVKAGEELARPLPPQPR
jgi:predicted small lipoprotein YifL